MKHLKFNLDNLFRLSTISAVQTFELENNSTELIISTDVKPELAYELHIESPEGKSFVILEKADGAVKCLLNSGMLKLGVNKIQLRGIGANDYSIESNRVEFTVKSFINASVEPEPSEQTAFEKLVVEVNVLKNDVDSLSDKIDSTESAVAALGAELELEKINRANSDSLLDSKIEAEREAREMEDSSIKSSIQALDNAKQDKLVAGENITIEGNVISAKGGGTGDVTKEYVDQQDEAIKAMIPSKTSELENDSQFVTRQELNEKMEFYKLDYIGGALSHEGVVLNYQQIVDKFNDDQYFVYATDGSFVFIPCLPPLPGDEILEFSSTYIYGGKNYIARIIINSENQVKWEEIEVARASDVKVDDVQINGTSIVSDGVANVPIANANSLGAVKGNTLQGVMINDAGEIYLYGATDDNLAKRQTYRPILATNYDKAVKQAMCDGKGAEWTEQEKASARARMGVGGGEFQLIEEITLAESTSSIVRTTKPNGDNLNLKMLYIIFEVPQASSSGNVKVFASDKVDYTRYIAEIPNGIQTSKRNFYALCEIKGGIPFVNWSAPSTNTTTSTYGYTFAGFGMPSSRKFSVIDKFFIATTVDLPVGTKINIYGVDA